MSVPDTYFDPPDVRSGLALQCLATPTFGAYYVIKAEPLNAKEVALMEGYFGSLKTPVLAHIREVPWYWDEDIDLVVTINERTRIEIPVEAVCAALGIKSGIPIRLLEGDAWGKGLATGHQLTGAYTFMKGFVGVVLFTQRHADELANSTENFVRKEFNAKTT